MFGGENKGGGKDSKNDRVCSIVDTAIQKHMLQSFFVSPPKKKNMYGDHRFDFISETIGRIQCLLFEYKKRTLVYIHVNPNIYMIQGCDVYTLSLFLFTNFFIKSQSLLLFFLLPFFPSFFKPFFFFFFS